MSDAIMGLIMDGSCTVEARIASASSPKEALRVILFVEFSKIRYEI
jgi:hypothetical protein